MANSKLIAKKKRPAKEVKSGELWYSKKNGILVLIPYIIIGDRVNAVQKSACKDTISTTKITAVVLNSENSQLPAGSTITIIEKKSSLEYILELKDFAIFEGSVLLSNNELD